MLSIPEPQPAVHVFPHTGQPVRTVVRNGAVWWVAADVAAVLDIGRTHDAVRSLDEDEKGTETVRTPGGEQSVTVINEPGLYSLILRSRKREARAFKRWVTHEVLPAIRSTGGYETPTLGDPLAELEQENQRTARAIEIARAYQARALELEPSAAAWDALAAEAVGDYSVRETAQLLSREPCIRTGQNRLFATLRELGWIDASGEPYQREVDAGRLVRRTLSYSHPHTGEPVLTSQVRVTPKGLAALRDRLGCGRQLPTAAPAA
jgi:anti-repressor protein